MQTIIVKSSPSPFTEPPSIPASATMSDNSSVGSSPDIDVVGQTPKPTIERCYGSTLYNSDKSGHLMTSFECEDYRNPGGGALKRYLCQRCLNHGEHWPRKGHKPFCRHSQCTCALCVMVDERRRLNNAICRQTSISDEEKTNGQGAKIRNPMCARCSAHGIQNRLKNHKKRCPYSECTCNLCKLVDERRDLMARQIKLRRQQNQRRRMVESRAQSPVGNSAAAGGGALLPTITFPYESEQVSSGRSSLLRNALIRPLEDDSPSSSNTIQSSLNNSAGLHSPIKTQLSLASEALGEYLPPIMSTTASGMPVPRLQNYTMPPTQTLFVPIRVPINNSHVHQNTNERCPMQGCVSCLEEALRHEIKMAELLRLVASNSQYSTLLERINALQPAPVSPPFGHSGIVVSRPIAMASTSLMSGTSAFNATGHSSNPQKDAILLRARAELAYMLDPERNPAVLN